MLQNFRFFLLCFFSIAFLFSCSNDFTEGDVLQEEASKRDVGEATATNSDDCNSTGNQEQTLNLTDKDLKRPTKDMEAFLDSLGFDYSVLCSGDCESDEDCIVTNVSCPSGSDLATLPGSGTSQVIRGFRFKHKDQDKTKVKVILKAVCKCK